MSARVSALIPLFLAVHALGGEPVALKPVQSWEGSARDETKAESVPKVVTDGAKFKEVWKLCERTDPVPAVDFHQQIAIVQTSRGSHINLRASLSDEGELRVMGIETRDFRPGFRYTIAIYSREGVKTVDGTALPK